MLSREDQLAVFDRCAEAAYREAVDLIVHNKELVLRVARERFAAGINVFGDEMFSRPVAALMVEVLEEAADMVAWGVAVEHQVQSASTQGDDACGHSGPLQDSAGLTCSGG